MRRLRSALQKLVETTETAGRESSESFVDEEVEVLLLGKQGSCIEGHVQRGGGTDTVENALLHSTKSQGHGRVLYFCTAAEAELLIS